MTVQEPPAPGVPSQTALGTLPRLMFVTLVLQPSAFCVSGVRVAEKVPSAFLIVSPS